MPNSSPPQLTAAAGNYAYAYLRIWARWLSPWRPVNVFIANMELLLQFFMFTLTLSLYRFRDTGAIGLGGLLNYISSLHSEW
jgi:hypothetical protein